MPGVIRQRIKQVIEELKIYPRPSNSKIMNISLKTNWEAHRIRINEWRIIYVINEQWQEIGILAIRKRPPYDYQDLTDLFVNLH